MNMPIKFDTLSYARKLEEAGLSQQQAEAQSLALRDALAESTVTPGDMLLMKTDVIARIEILRSDVHAQIEKLRSDLQGQIDALKGQVVALKAQIAELKAHMNIRFNILYMLTGLSLVLHGVTLGVLFKILSRLP
ncbi:coiled-coil domain-containing protein [Duganella violaceipulchra]|uniref:CCDC90 family protein n=1 Tax=Duganella violaceipulchra TaxID=2849652 RepID=A0AA41H7M0_9BURK|nr:coiled-coil domain-containing protein [Duganella violaceicalia]MBV6320885.1 CCDC90 family protein [Duganella violaceicalia]MCP2008404.1 chaperonin cofactor prefoldin [Duganella violaceicalia]